MSLNTLVEVGLLVPELDHTKLQPFLTAATLVVTESLSNKGLTSDRLKLIEAYIAGHYALISYGEKSAQEIGDSSETYVKTKSGQGFFETALGRQAVALDESGTLVSKGKTAGYFELLT